MIGVESNNDYSIAVEDGNRVYYQDYTFVKTQNFQRVWEQLITFTNNRNARHNSNNTLNTYQHIEKGCLIISANNDIINNESKLIDLAFDINKNNLGYIRLLGSFIDEHDNKISKDCYIVPFNTVMSEQEFIDFSIKLCNQYNQSIILIKLPSNDMAYYYNNNGYEIDSITNFTINNRTIIDYYVRLINKNNKISKLKLNYLSYRVPSSSYGAREMDIRGELR